MSEPSRLTAFDDFASNPGNLTAYRYLPRDLPPGAPLVVVLHGCTQTATVYDRGSGWSTLADRAHFALLFPEQRPANNDNRCFNWFEATDNRRDIGEPKSIRQMVEAMLTAHRLDPCRVFITGLSAGGAMTSVMLASYPEVFAGGAIIAGLAYGGVDGVDQALTRMAGNDRPASAALAAAVYQASPHRGPWPKVSIWQGTADQKVHPSNASAILDQWRAVHGLAEPCTRTELVDGHSRRIWCDQLDEPVIDEFIIDGMAHGTPLKVSPRDLGEPGAHMLDAGISSTLAIARFWGISA